MVWGAFEFNKVSQLYRVKEILENKQYHSIFVHKAVPAGKRLIGRGFILQHGPKHTSSLCQSYLKKKKEDGNLKIMIWPPQSPNVNPIELPWRLTVKSGNDF